MAYGRLLVPLKKVRIWTNVGILKLVKKKLDNCLNFEGKKSQNSEEKSQNFEKTWNFKIS